jgi:Hsp20/alpha crystallin family
MSVIRYEPFRDPFERLITMAATRTRAPLAMPMDVYRSEDGSYHVEADLPSVDPDGIEVTVEHGTLTIQPERTPHYGESERVIITEGPQGSFTRQLTKRSLLLCPATAGRMQPPSRLDAPAGRAPAGRGKAVAYGSLKGRPGVAAAASRQKRTVIDQGREFPPGRSCPGRLSRFPPGRSRLRAGQRRSGRLRSRANLRHRTRI